jgi:hypothetical protein
MKVGIGAICEANTDEPMAVVAADRLVTSGRAARREHEHTSSKMVSIVGEDGNSPVVAVGVGAGSVSLSDEVFFKINQRIRNETPDTTRDVANYGVTALQEVVQETINRQVLSSHDLDLQSFNQMQGQMNPQIVQGIYQDMMQMKDDILQQVNILLAGVDANGAHLFNVRHNDMARNDSIGYMTVGSGAEPADSSFIRNRYDDTCDRDDALLSVTEAKAQSEEAQGVGQEMDIAILREDGRRDLTDNEVGELRELYEEIVEAENEARDDVIDERSCEARC